MVLQMLNLDLLGVGEQTRVSIKKEVIDNALGQAQAREKDSSS